MAGFQANEARKLVSDNRDALGVTAGMVRNTIDSKICEAARRGRPGTTYAVPGSMFGRPPFERADLAEAVAANLRADGYAVAIAGSGGSQIQLSISWERPPSQQHAAVSSSSAPPVWPADIASAISQIDLGQRTASQPRQPPR